MNDPSFLFFAAVASGLPRLRVGSAENCPPIIRLLFVEGEFLGVEVPDTKGRDEAQ